MPVLLQTRMSLPSPQITQAEKTLCWFRFEHLQSLAQAVPWISVTAPFPDPSLETKIKTGTRSCPTYCFEAKGRFPREAADNANEDSWKTQNPQKLEKYHEDKIARATRKFHACKQRREGCRRLAFSNVVCAVEYLERRN